MSDSTNTDLRNKYPNQYSDRENRAFEKFIQGSSEDNLKNFSIEQATIFLSEISELPSEVAQSLVIWLLHQNLPQSTLDFILASDLDGDGISLRDELANGTNPFKYDNSRTRTKIYERAREKLDMERD
jgi:hypothetical protein